MILLEKGKYRARLAVNREDLHAAQSLRAQAFARPHALDRDSFDDVCAHVLIDRVGDTAPVACFRCMHVPPQQIASCYSAQFYDLSRLATQRGPMLELGRFCLRRGVADPDILRVAWAALTRIVDDQGFSLLFGCTSFPGTDPSDHAEAFAYLNARHLAPSPWQPGRKSDRAISLVQASDALATSRAGWAKLPALLKTYVSMGGWVSDHAVVDADMNTLHVFTGVEVRNIPETRARLLRAVAM